MEPATTDHVQRMIDAEATKRFPSGAVPQLALLHYGDHPVIEPGELYLLVILGQDGATRDAWMEEHFDRLEDLRAQRLPEVKGFMVTTDVRDSAGLPPSAIMQLDGISLLDPDRSAGRTARFASDENSAFRCRVLPGVVSQVGWTT